MPVFQLTDDQMCFGCGSRNARGLRLKFSLDRRRRTITTEWTPTKAFQGYANVVHGGLTALVLDEVMGNLLWTLKNPSVTAEMSVRFLKPAYVGQKLCFRAHVKHQKGRVLHVEAVATRSGTKIARASGVYIHI